jgi:hypothetical protein
MSPQRNGSGQPSLLEDILLYAAASGRDWRNSDAVATKTRWAPRQTMVGPISVHKKTSQPDMRPGRLAPVLQGAAYAASYAV